MNALVPMNPVPAMTVSDVEKVAGAIARGGLFGSKDPYAVLTLCLLAQAEGQHPAVVFRDYHIISGKPSKKAEAMLRDFLSAGGKIEWHALTDEIADATFSHPAGGTARISWDHARAVKAQLAGNAMYKKFPRQMLRSRVISEGVRTIYPGATSGLYVPEEVSQFDTASTPTPADDAPIDGGQAESAPTPQGDLPVKVPGIHKIKTAIRVMKAQGNAATDLETFERAVAAYQEEMSALETANHSWWTGEDGNGGFEGIPAWLARRRQELSGEDAVFVGLVESMRLCDSRGALDLWKEQNGDVIASLDGEEGRRFEMLLDDYEAGLELVETANA